MKIAVLGTGHMGRTLASGLLNARHEVVFGSREPSSHADFPAPVTTTVEAIGGADLVVSALNAAHSLDTLSPLADQLSGSILLDLGNAVNERFELIYPNSSLGERLQAALPKTRVVKTLNTVAGVIGIDPGVLPAPTNVFLSGDDADAKSVVAGLLSDLGWAPESQIDLGGIATARGPEHYFALFAVLMGHFGDGAFNIALVRAARSQE